MHKFINLSEKYKLELILLFGSHVQGGLHPESDMDIAVYSKRVLSETEKINITYDLQ